MGATARTRWLSLAVVWLVLVLGFAPAGAPALGALTAPNPAGAPSGAAPVRVRLLAINDVHGALDTTQVSNRPAGGAAVLAAYLDAWEGEARARGVPTIRVGAGDLIGASPPSSGLLHDEPTITALSMMGLRYSSVGNHEFDHGVDELLYLQNGGCRADGDCFAGARFQYLAANVVDANTGEPILPPYAVETVQGVPIGLIGIVLSQTASLVTPSGVAGVRFLDEVATVNRYVAELKSQGVRAIVVLIHQGGAGTRDGQVEGAIVPIVRGFDDEVDVVVSGHTHRGYQGLVAGKLVTQAFANGTAFAAIDMTIDPESGDVVEKQASIVDVWADEPPGTTPDPAIAALVAEASARVAPLVDRVVTNAATDVSRTQDAAGESALGNLIADAQRWRTQSDVAFMNPGGIRADLRAGPLTWGDLFRVQPFHNDLVTMTLSGAQIDELLEQQWQRSGRGLILPVSGLSYAWDPRAPSGSRVQPEDVSVCNPACAPLDLGRAYVVTVNSFLAEGGDDFTVLLDGTDRVVGPTDLDALVDYVAQLPQPLDAEAATLGRIRLR